MIQQKWPVNILITHLVTPSQMPYLAALLCGAGGTAKAAAYAFSQLGFVKVLVWNRSRDRATELCRNFTDKAKGVHFEVPSTCATECCNDDMPSLRLAGC